MIQKFNQQQKRMGPNSSIKCAPSLVAYVHKLGCSNGLSVGLGSRNTLSVIPAVIGPEFTNDSMRSFFPHSTHIRLRLVSISTQSDPRNGGGKKGNNNSSLLGLIFVLILLSMVRIIALFQPIGWKIRLFLSLWSFVMGFAFGRTKVGKKIESFVYGTRMFKQILLNLLSWEQAIVKKFGLEETHSFIHGDLPHCLYQ